MKLLFSIETLLALIFAIATFFIFSGDTTILRRFFYALIVGISSWMLLAVFKYTIIWFYNAIKKK